MNRAFTATPAVARLGPALEEMEPYGLRTQEGHAADQAFHYLILQSTPNEPLVILSNSTAASVDWTTIYARHERSELRDPVPDHHAVLEALAKVDARDARACMITLINTADTGTGVAPLAAEEAGI